MVVQKNSHIQMLQNIINTQITHYINKAVQLSSLSELVHLKIGDVYVKSTAKDNRKPLLTPTCRDDSVGSILCYNDLRLHKRVTENKPLKLQHTLSRNFCGRSGLLFKYPG